MPDETVTARELLECLRVATTWLKAMPTGRLGDNAPIWAGLVDANLVLQRRLGALFSEDVVIPRPDDVRGSGIGTTGTTGCRK